MRFEVFALAAVACGARADIGGLDDLASDASVHDAPGDTSPTRTVHGRFIVHYYPDSGEMDVPRDLSTTLIQALVGGATLSGSGAADGRFTIEHVPYGPFTLRVDDRLLGGATLFVGVEDGVTISPTFSGRPIAEPSSWDTLRFDVTLDNLTPLPALGNSPFQRPWSSLWIMSSNAGCALASVFFSAKPPPAQGATAVDHLSMVFQSPIARPCHIDVSLGDRSMLLQSTVPDPSGPQPNTRRIRKLDLSGFSTPPPLAPTVEVKGTLTDISPSSALHADFRPSTFKDALIATGGAAPDVFAALSEYPSQLPWLSSPAIVLGDISGQTDGRFDLPYADPEPNWTKVIFINGTANFTLSMPDSTTMPAYSSIRELRDLSTATSGPIESTLSTPLQVRVNDSAPQSLAMGVGPTPTISWTKPTRTPSGGLLRYSILVTEVPPTQAPPDYNASSFTFWTTESDLPIPSGLLKLGHTYLSSVTAHWTKQPIVFASTPIDGDVTENSSMPSGAFVP